MALSRIFHLYQADHSSKVLFVCVEVLWPSQPDGVMLSAVVYLTTFTGQA